MFDLCVLKYHVHNKFQTGQLKDKISFGQIFDFVSFSD